MPRRPRAEYEIGVYHVTGRGNRKQPIYVDDKDRARYISTLARVTLRMEWYCLAYCLMGNHVHLLIETRETNLGTGMQRLHGSYAQYFNKRHRLSGHLFQDRFHCVGVRSDPQFWVVAAYIACNPVTAGLCPAPNAWRWSSHAAITHGRPPCRRPGRRPARALRRVRRRLRAQT
jgi:putative transposase